MDDILDRDIQSRMGARDFGRIDAGYGTLAQPELVECSLMRNPQTGAWGVAKRGGRYVVALPAGYDHNVGIMPQDGRLLVTHPGLPTLVADCETGTVRRL